MAPTITYYGFAPPLPAPAPHLPSTSNRQPCPIEDGTPDSPDNDRRLCTHFDPEPCPECDDSSIIVDLVMASFSSLACIYLLHSLEPLITFLSHLVISLISFLSLPSNFLFLLLLSFSFPSLFPFLPSPSSVTVFAGVSST